MSKSKKVLAVSSGGGHWQQLRRVAPAFEGCEVVYVGVHENFRSSVAEHRFHLIPDAIRWQKFRLCRAALRLLWILLRERPDVVCSTGAAPGFLAVVIGKLLGARTIWIDSIANAGELSMSGRKVGRWADLWLTQWPHLASDDGPRYAGRTI